MTVNQRSFSSILVGGGPAGIAVLLSALREGRLRELLRNGLLIVERGSTLGTGQIGTYAINSDSTGETFLDPLRRSGETALQQVLDTPVAREIEASGQGAVPLKLVGELMALIGSAMRSLLQEYPNCAVLTGSTAEHAQALPAGGWQLVVHGANGTSRRFMTRHLILATGAAQPRERLGEESIAGVSVLQRWGSKVVQSGDVLLEGGLDRVAAALRGRTSPKVAILGGSTSAMAAAHALLHRMQGVEFAAGGVTVFSRRPLRVYYTSAAEAVADGYTDFDTSDLCPVTNRLYRFAGLRLDSRELLLQANGLGGRSPEPRLQLHPLGKRRDREALRQIDAADLVIAAFGYRPNGLPLLDRGGRMISLLAHTGPSAPLVDDRCRVMDAHAQAIPGVYGIGLAAGFRPQGRFGGEPSFRGQVNGLWVWQNGVGSIIANAILDGSQGAAIRVARPASRFANAPRLELARLLTARRFA